MKFNVLAPHAVHLSWLVSVVVESSLVNSPRRLLDNGGLVVCVSLAGTRSPFVPVVPRLVACCRCGPVLWRPGVVPLVSWPQSSR